jgi:hypothetical protein
MLLSLVLCASDIQGRSRICSQARQGEGTRFGYCECFEKRPIWISHHRQRQLSARIRGALTISTEQQKPDTRNTTNQYQRTSNPTPLAPNREIRQHIQQNNSKKLRTRGICKKEDPGRAEPGLGRDDHDERQSAAEAEVQASAALQRYSRTNKLPTAGDLQMNSVQKMRRHSSLL